MFDLNIPVLIPPRNLKLRAESVLLCMVVLVTWLMPLRMAGFPLELFHLNINEGSTVGIEPNNRKLLMT